MEQYVGHALRAGIEEICFLDHLTLNQRGRGLSMTPDEIPLYYYAARRMQAAYSGRIKIKVGLEIDFTPELYESAQKAAGRFDFDVIGGSVHFVGDRNLVSSSAAGRQSQKQNAAFYETYLDLVDRMLDCSFIDIVCHLDVVKKFGAIPPEWFYERLGALLDKIAQSGKVLEINTSGAAHPVGEIYPRPELLEKCHGKNIFLCLGSDAHLPEQVGRGFAGAADMIKKAGYSRITGFERRTCYQIPLKG